MSTRHDGMWAKPGFTEDLWVWSRPRIHGSTSAPVELEQGCPIQGESTEAGKSSRMHLNTRRPSGRQLGFGDGSMGGGDSYYLGMPINEIHWVGGGLEDRWAVFVLPKVLSPCLLPSISVLLFSNCPLLQDQGRIESELKQTFQSNVTLQLGLRWKKMRWIMQMQHQILFLFENYILFIIDLGRLFF